MFSNFYFLLLDNIGTIQKDISKQIILNNSGNILKRSIIPKRFKKVQLFCDLDIKLTHILVGDKNTSINELSNSLYCLGISPKIKIIHWTWLQECLNLKSPAPTFNYEITGKSKSVRNKVSPQNFSGFSSIVASTTTTATTATPAPIVSPPNPTVSGSKRKFLDPSGTSSTSIPATITSTGLNAVTPTSLTTSSNDTTSNTTSSVPPPLPPPSSTSSSSSSAAAAAPPSKLVRSSGFDCIDAANSSFGGHVDVIGNGWFLLHNVIDGDRTPSLLFKFANITRSCSNVIGFDMDSTLIETKSGATFAKDASDWKFWDSSVPTELQSRYNSGSHLFIVSNQNGVNKGHVTIPQLTTKFDNIVAAIGVPMDIACAFANDAYRKPRTGAWEFLARNRFVNYATDETTRLSILGSSTYVGDAAGRPKTRDRSKDFSASDYKLSLNLGIAFLTPEQFFKNSKAPYDCDRSGVDLGFSLEDFIRKNVFQTVDATIFDVPSPSVRLEIILLIGPPACGKSTIARRLEASGNCVRINQDTLKTRPACLKAARTVLTSGKSVIVDNTNSNTTQRKDWINLAQSIGGVTLRCIRIDMPKELCFHMITYRLSNPETLEEDRREIPSVAVHTFYKNVQEPTVSEGFTRVDRVPFVPIRPKNPELAKLLFSYLG